MSWMKYRRPLSTSKTSLAVLSSLCFIVLSNTAFGYDYVVTGDNTIIDGGDYTGSDSDSGLGWSWELAWWRSSGSRADYTTSGALSMNCSSFTSLTSAAEATGDTLAYASKSAYARGHAVLYWDWNGPPGTAPGLDATFDYQAYSRTTVAGEIAADPCSAARSYCRAASQPSWVINADIYGRATTTVWADVRTGQSPTTNYSAQIVPQLPGDTTDHDMDLNSDSFEGYSECIVVSHSDSYEVAPGGTRFVMASGCDTSVQNSIAANSTETEEAESWIYTGRGEGNTSVRNIVVTPK